MTPESLCELIGEDATLALLSQRSGVRVYIPKVVTERIIEECGGDAKSAEILCREMGANFIILPTAKRWRMAQLLKRGFSIRDISIALNVTRDAVVKAQRVFREQNPETPVYHEASGPKAA